MRDFFHNILHRYGILSKIGLVALGTLLVVFLLPDEVRFKYDFEIGRPWIHQDLYAPFDYALIKPASQFEEERQRLIESFPPYFNYEDSVRIEIQSDIQIALEVAFPSLSVDELVENERTTFNLINPIIAKGIIAYHPILDSTDNGIIRSVRNKVANDVGVESVYTLQSAVDSISFKAKELGYPDSSLLISIAIENIRPNLFYDSSLTNEATKFALQELSSFSGSVRESERLVSKGELVSEEIAIKLESLRIAFDKRTHQTVGGLWIDVGRVVLICINLLLLFFYLNYFRKDIIDTTSKFSFIFTVYVLFISLGAISLKLEFFDLYMIPFPLLAVLIKNFFDSRLAAFVVLIQVIPLGLIAPNGYEFVFLQGTTGVIVAFALNNLRSRSQLLRIALLTFFTYALLYSAFTLLKEGTPSAFSLEHYLSFGISAGLMLLTYPLVYVFEKTFKLVSEVTLLELADTHNVLLRRLLELAPGTFQHSLQVAHLAEDAASEINANALLVRTAALYHDIGKMNHPEYFIENQIAGANPHNDLAPEKSAEIIIRHVIDGVELARKHGLPEQIIDFIRTHHGDTRVRFFLHAAKQINPDVDEEKFKYPGPLPYSKETAILMMVDAVEAASRSLTEYNAESLDELVENIVNNQQNEGQFNHADITLLEITKVKSLLKNRLKSIYHVRVPYPKAED